MRRILVLLSVALMMVMMTALSGAALAQPVAGSADARCLELARQTIGFGPNFNPANTTFIGGTEGRDDFTGRGTEGRDVFCGFGGGDRIHTLDEGDIFLGGEGDDEAFNNFGTFYGGEGDDWVKHNFGTFYGGEGNDRVAVNYDGTVDGVENVEIN